MGLQEAWVLCLALPLTGAVTFGKSLSRLPQFLLPACLLNLGALQGCGWQCLGSAQHNRALLSLSSSGCYWNITPLQEGDE